MSTLKKLLLCYKRKAIIDLNIYIAIVVGMETMEGSNTIRVIGSKFERRLLKS